MSDFSDPNNRPWDELFNRLTTIKVELPIETLEILALRHKFTELTGVSIPTGGDTVGTEEGRMIRLAMRELGYARENECVNYGWNVRYGIGDKWGKWQAIPFKHDCGSEYRAAIAGLEAQ